MFDVKLQANGEEFFEWVERTRSRFETMVLTMVDVAELIKANTNQLVPLDTGRLESSYYWEVLEDNSNFVTVQAGYSIEHAQDGFEPELFDYALYQHQLVTLNHPKRGEAFYLYKGIQASKSMAYQIIETDYMSLFGFVRGVY